MDNSHKALILRSLIERRMSARTTPADSKTMRDLAADLGLPDPTGATLAQLYKISNQAFDMLNDQDRLRDEADNNLALEQFDATQTPNPPTADYWRWLCAAIGSQRAAAKALQIDERTVRRWCAGDRQSPWAIAELLRRMVAERTK